MAHAYTPGLKVLQETQVVKERRLPVKGKVVVEKNQKVTPDDVVAQTELPGNVQMVNVANMLNIDPTDINDALCIKVGESVKKGDLLAESSGLFGMFKSKVDVPVDCVIESCSDVTGQVCCREAPIPVAIDAYVSGVIKDTITDEGVFVETRAAFIQGIFGIGGENRGDLLTVTPSREEEITAEMITNDMKGKIIVGGSFISLQAFKKALAMKVAGVVVGGFNYHDLKDILGYTLGVAITGSEEIGTALIVTEGYGKIRMGQRTFDLLKQLNGKFASVNGATQIRAGVIRPEIVIPLSETDIKGNHKDFIASSGIQTGSTVRVIRAPFFGRMGKVVELPHELRKMESETMVRVAILEIDGKNVEIPRSNLEMVETD